MWLRPLATILKLSAIATIHPHPMATKKPPESMKKLVLIFTSLLVGSLASAELSMPQVFGDQMVLQAEKPIHLWGQAAPGGTVKVSFLGQTAEAVAEENGKWSVTLPARAPASEGATLMVSDGEETLEFKDVLVGEVWFASGQSNMEWRLSQLGPFKEEAIAGANYPQIRFFRAAKVASGSPQSDVGGKWTVCTPQNAQAYSAVGYFFARKLHTELDRPVAIIQAAWGGKPIETFTRREALRSIPQGREKMDKQDTAIAAYDPAAAQEEYQAALKTYQAALAAWKATPESDRSAKAPKEPKIEKNPGEQPGRPATIWNGMIQPFVGYTLRGAIWYQGESNRREPESYGRLFELMINDWRYLWKDDFRFLWAQLANFQRPVVNPGTNHPWAVIQEHQRRTLKVPKTGMAIINDIGDAKDIHPRNKHDVGERLARWALADEYGREVVRSGPILAAHVVRGNLVELRFAHTAKGLKTSDGEALRHFEIKDTEGKWHWANAKIVGSSGTIVVSHPEVREAAAARYAWAPNPATANLVNSEGLPASLFTTDWRTNPGQVILPVDGSELVTYQAAPLENPLSGETFKGSNFIHPLKTPSGFVVTDSEPRDHPHHFGLWWPWKFIEHDGRRILCWELQDGDGVVEARGAESTTDGLVAESVYLDRKAPEGPTVRINETTKISTSPIVSEPAEGYYLDLTIQHEAAGEKPITISKYRYSGLGYRGSPLWDKDSSTILTSSGAVRENANSTEARWVRIEGTNGMGGSAGLLMMAHPDNHAHPEKLRTWSERHYNGAIFINFNPVMDEAFVLQTGQTYTRKYRLFVYDGELAPSDAEVIWKNYSQSR